jgi:hypothetical protein
MDVTSGGSPQPGLQLTKVHRNVTDQHSNLQFDLPKDNPLVALRVLAKASADFEALTFAERDRLLQGHLSWSDGDTAVCEWVAGRYDHLARIAADTVPALPVADARQVTAQVSLCALALVLLGHAIKWRKISGQRADVSLRDKAQRLFAVARKARFESHVVTVVLERTEVETSNEALFLRVLLVERFASGNLIPRRLEILDSWLVASPHAMWLSKEPAASGGNFCVEPGSGTRPLIPCADGDVASRYLPLHPLVRQLQTIAGEFHGGEIYPGWGLGMKFRIEDHISVMDFLDREFRLVQSAGAKKSKRLPIAGEKVNVFVGFNDVYLRGLANQSAIAPVAGADGVSLSKPIPLTSLVAANSETGTFAALDSIQGPVSLLDISETGLGLEMSAADAALVEIDSLVAVKLNDNQPCLIGTVVRQAIVPKRPATLVGVKLLSRVPLRTTLEEVSERTVRSTMKGIFIGGAGNDWANDSVIVNDATYRTSTTMGGVMSATVGNSRFHIRLGRIRLQGPGWKMAAIHVIVAH